MALQSTQPLTNEYQEYFLRGKGGQCVGPTTLPPSWADCHAVWERSSPGSHTACPGLYRDCFIFLSTIQALITPQTTHKSHCCTVLRFLDGMGRFLYWELPWFPLVAPHTSVGWSNEVVRYGWLMHGKRNPVWYNRTDVSEDTSASLIRLEYLAILTRHDLYAVPPTSCLPRWEPELIDRVSVGKPEEMRPLGRRRLPNFVWKRVTSLFVGWFAGRTWKNNNKC